MKYPRISLEQWLTFKTVVDEGTFSKAAEVLSKSQSSISYTISKMEEQLPSPALEIRGRKAVLTEIGMVLYRRAVQLLDMALDIEEAASCIAKGWETEVALNVDSIVPFSPVLKAVDDFCKQAPQTRVSLLESTLSGTTEALLERRADIVLSSQTPPGYFGTRLTTISMIAVAHTNHPLNLKRNILTEQDLLMHRQIVVRDSGSKRTQNTGWLEAEQRLTVSHFSHSVLAIQAGLGFAFVPKHVVNDYLVRGEFKQLSLDTDVDRQLTVYLTLATPDKEGPAVKALTQNLLDVFSVY